MIPAAPNKPVVARRARARARRPDFRGRRREGPPYIDFGSVCPNGSSGSTKTEPAVEVNSVYSPISVRESGFIRDIQ